MDFPLYQTYWLELNNGGDTHTALFGGDREAELDDNFCGYPEQVQGDVSYRTTIQDLQEAHGSSAGPSFYGPRVFSIRVLHYHENLQMRDLQIERLSRTLRLTRDGARPVFYARRNDGEVVSCRLTPNTPITESSKEVTRITSFTATATDPRMYNDPDDKSRVMAGGAIELTVFNKGDEPSPADRIKLTGPITSPVITNTVTYDDATTLVQTLSFPGLVVPSGEYLEIKVPELTMWLNGSEDQDAYGSFAIFDSTRFEQFSIIPGHDNVFSVTGTSTTNGETALEVEWRSAWM